MGFQQQGGHTGHEGRGEGRTVALAVPFDRFRIHLVHPFPHSHYIRLQAAVVRRSDGRERDALAVGVDAAHGNYAFPIGRRGHLFVGLATHVAHSVHDHDAAPHRHGRRPRGHGRRPVHVGVGVPVAVPERTGDHVGSETVGPFQAGDPPVLLDLPLEGDGLRTRKEIAGAVGRPDEMSGRVTPDDRKDRRAVIDVSKTAVGSVL